MIMYGLSLIYQSVYIIAFEIQGVDDVSSIDAHAWGSWINLTAKMGRTKEGLTKEVDFSKTLTSPYKEYAYFNFKFLPYI